MPLDDFGKRFPPFSRARQGRLDQSSATRRVTRRRPDRRYIQLFKPELIKTAGEVGADGALPAGSMDTAKPCIESIASPG